MINRQASDDCERLMEIVDEDYPKDVHYPKDVPGNHPKETPSSSNAIPDEDTYRDTYSAPDVKDDTVPFVSSTDALLTALTDMHHDEESLMFTTRSGELTCILQSTSESDDEIMSFELALVYDEDTDCHGKLKTLLDHEYGAMYNEEEENWTLYVFTLTRNPPTEDLYAIKRYLNKTYDMRICECFDHFVKSEKSVCYRCTMCQTPGSSDRRETCVICNDPIETPMGSITMRSCCNQVMHKRCLELWRRDDATKICPVCRRSTTDRSRDTTSHATS